MKTKEKTFLMCVLIFAGVFVFRTVHVTEKLLSTRLFPEAAGRGTAGKARDVDMPRLEALLEQGYLSQHRALHFRKVE